MYGDAYSPVVNKGGNKKKDVVILFSKHLASY